MAPRGSGPQKRYKMSLINGTGVKKSFLQNNMTDFILHFTLLLNQYFAANRCPTPHDTQTLYPQWSSHTPRCLGFWSALYWGFMRDFPVQDTINPNRTRKRSVCSFCILMSRQWAWMWLVNPPSCDSTSHCAAGRFCEWQSEMDRDRDLHVCWQTRLSQGG